MAAISPALIRPSPSSSIRAIMRSMRSSMRAAEAAIISSRSRLPSPSVSASAKRALRCAIISSCVNWPSPSASRSAKAGRAWPCSPIGPIAATGRLTAIATGMRAPSIRVFLIDICVSPVFCVSDPFHGPARVFRRSCITIFTGQGLWTIPVRLSGEGSACLGWRSGVTLPRTPRPDKTIRFRVLQRCKGRPGGRQARPGVVTGRGMCELLRVMQRFRVVLPRQPGLSRRRQTR